MYRYMDDKLSEKGFDGKIKGKPLGQILAEMSKGDVDYSIGAEIVKTGRPIEGINAMEQNRELAAKNGLSELAYDRYARTVNDDVRLYGHYFSRHGKKAMPALFLLPEDRIDFRAITGEAIIDPKTMTNPEPFHLETYIADNTIDFAELNARIKNTVTTYLQNGGTSEGYEMIVNGAREAASMALLAKQPNMKNPAVKDLVLLINDPHGYCINFAKENGLNKLPMKLTATSDWKSMQKQFQAAQKVHENDRKTFMKSEKTYNKSVDKLLRNVAKLEKRCQKEKDPDRTAQLRATIDVKKQELAELKSNELESLKAAAQCGLVTSVYYAQRTKDVVNGNHNRQTSMFIAGLCDKKTFIKEQLEQNGIPKKEAERQYKELKATEAQARASHDLKIDSKANFRAEIEKIDNPPEQKTVQKKNAICTKINLNEELDLSESIEKNQQSKEAESPEKHSEKLKTQEQETERNKPDKNPAETVKKETEEPELEDFGGLL